MLLKIKNLSREKMGSLKLESTFWKGWKYVERRLICCWKYKGCHLRERKKLRNWKLASFPGKCLKREAEGGCDDDETWKASKSRSQEKVIHITINKQQSIVAFSFSRLIHKHSLSLICMHGLLVWEDMITKNKRQIHQLNWCHIVTLINYGDLEMWYQLYIIFLTSTYKLIIKKQH